MFGLQTKLFRVKNQKRNNHFFQRNSTVLIRIFIITHIMIVIVDISQEQVIFCKNIRATHIYGG